MNERASTAPLRVGSVPYLVGRPLDVGLEREAGIELVRRVPAELVAAIRAGALDVALVSSIELFRVPGYRYIDGLAVLGVGFVGSVQVFLRCAIEDVRSLALDPASRAAAALVRVLFERAPGGSRERLPRRAVRMVEVPSGVDPRAVDADAWLRIGDPALREHLSETALPWFNPSEEWALRTQLPFAFAVWIVRPGVQLSDAQLGAFHRSRQLGRERTEALAVQASAEWSLPLDACRRYLLRECSYDAGPELALALRRFQGEAAALDLCRADLDPAPIG
jgi:chorismate dehydratase